MYGGDIAAIGGAVMFLAAIIIGWLSSEEG